MGIPQQAGIGFFIGFVVFNRVQHRHQFIAQIHGNNGGRSLVGTQTMVVGSAGYRNAQKILMLVDRFDHRAQKQQEHGIPVWFVGRVEQVDPCIGGN